MTIKELYDSAHELTKSMSNKNKYTYLAFHKVIEAKYLDVNDTITGDLPISGYINKYMTVLLIPNRVNDVIVDIFVRPLEGKGNPLKLVESSLPYGIGKLQKDFKYGDFIVLVEGIGDYGALKFIDPTINVLAVGTNGVTADLYPIIASLTSNVILIPDNDKAGRSQVRTVINKFKSLGVSVSVIKQYSNFKDTGELLDILVEQQTSKELLMLIADYYKTQIAFAKSVY